MKVELTEVSAFDTILFKKIPIRSVKLGKITFAATIIAAAKTIPPTTQNIVLLEFSIK